MRAKKAAAGLIAAGLIAASAGTAGACPPKAVQAVKPSSLEFKIWDFLFGKKQTTFEKYGRNIKYYSFSQLDEGRIPLGEMKLPNDLEHYITNDSYQPLIENPKKFRDEVMQEALKLGYKEESFRSMSAKEAIMAAVEITGSKINYLSVDWNRDFINEHGESLPRDRYFSIGLGDCDKYRDITIAIFGIIKKENPKLKNVYLSIEELGGYMWDHAWVSILIPRDDEIMLCHIDPTFYDNGGKLEAGEKHIMVKNGAYQGYFYRKLNDCENSYMIFDEAMQKCSKEELETLIDAASFTLFLFSGSKAEFGAERIEGLLQRYSSEGFNARLDTMLYRAHRIYKEAGNREKSEHYRQRVLTEFPDSYWVGNLKNNK